MNIYFIAPNYMAVRNALAGIPGQNTHGWSADGDETVIGVAEVTSGDTEQVAAALEAADIMLLPDHRTSEKITAEHHAKLSKHGVLPTHTTKEALAQIHKVSGFPPLKPKRYS
jgi:hypothetical protein